MSVEQQPNSGERFTNNAELESLAQERLKSIESAPEQATEQAEKRAEEAREVITAQEDAPEPNAAAAEKSTTSKPTFIATLDAKVNYTQTMQSVQRRLKPASRAFSKTIHNPVVEQTSEVLGKTVMRPSVINGALWCAAIVGLVFYFTARTYGYKLSGSEMLLSFVVGGLIGLGIELIWRAAKHGRT